VYSITSDLRIDYTVTSHLHFHYNYNKGAKIMCIDNYVKIVEEILARGEKITLQEVRRIAGKGSYSTISEAIKSVLNRGLIPVEIAGPVPDRLGDVTQHLWQEACKLASAVVATERIALHSARVASQENLRELTVLADTLALQVDDLTIQVENIGTARDKAEKRAQEAEFSLKTMKQILKDFGLKSVKTEDDKGQMSIEV
jgi:hypothetical protein